ncbi:MAG: hypothetical protein L6R28_13100 [Planctomycetes bacterium]|nr:hypothetical protein [Planctomycetota bacterium]
MARRSDSMLRSPARAGALALGVLLAGLWSPVAQLCCVVETAASQDRSAAERTELRLMVHVPVTRKSAAPEAPAAQSKSKPAQTHFQRPFSGETEPSVIGRGGLDPLALPGSGFAQAFAAVVPVRTSGPAPPDPESASTRHPSSAFAAAFESSRAARGPPAV